MPRELLPRPALEVAGLDDIKYNAWTAIGCDDAPVPVQCSDYRLCPNAAPCLRIRGAYGDGICASQSGGATVLTYAGGDCHAFVSPEWKAGACCAGLAGVDCRQWPFDRTSGPGELCVTHDDCEPGLLCTGPSYYSYALCTCPGVELSQVTHPPSCRRTWTQQEPSPAMEPGECRYAENTEYSVQALPAEAGTRILSTASGAGGVSLLLTTDGDQVKLARGVRERWTVENVSSLRLRVETLPSMPSNVCTWRSLEWGAQLSASQCRRQLA